MNNQAESWVWNYAETVEKFCKKYFPQDTQTAKDMAHDVLVKLSQKEGLDQVGDRSSWIRMVAYHECMDYFRELKRKRVWKADTFEDPGEGADEKLSDAKLDMEAGGSAEDIENEADGPDSKDESEKIDPMEVWRSFKRYDPDRAAALIRSSFYVNLAFSGIRWWRNSLNGIGQDIKLIAILQDVKQRIEKIFGTCTDQDIKKYADSIGTGRERKFDTEVLSSYEIHYHIKQLIKFFRLDEFLADIGIKKVAQNVMMIPDYVFQRSSVPIDFFTTSSVKDDVFHYFQYRMRTRDFIHVDPDPLYVRYRIWNRILRKGREGKYGNRKLLKVLLFAFQKIAQERLKDDTMEYLDDDTFNSLTEETNFETLRTMSYRLNKEYSKLADFIYRKSVRPLKRKTTPTDEKKPALPSSISSNH